jgi:hypothetical protein
VPLCSLSLAMEAHHAQAGWILRLAFYNV